MTTDEPERIWSGLDLAKVIAGTLAAVSAAVCASFLGVAGTLVGAAVASLVGTVGQELYAQSLKRGYRRLRSPRINASSATPGTVSPHEPPVRQTSAGALHRSSARADATTAGTHLPTARPGTTPGTGIRWRRVVLAAVGAFALTMLAVTAVELMSGRALAGMLGDESAGGSTIGSVVDGPRTPEPAPIPAPAVSATDVASTPTPTGTDGPAPTTAPTSDAPAAPTTEPTAPPPGQLPNEPGASGRP